MMRPRKRDLSDVWNCPETSRRTNERMEFACKEGCRSPLFEGREEEQPDQAAAARWDVYLTRSNLIKNLIKSDFWAAPESVPNQPRRLAIKLGKNFPSPFSSRFSRSSAAPRRTFMASPSDINVSRVSNLTADFSPILVYACAPTGDFKL